MFYWSEFIKELNGSITEGDVVLDAGAGDGHWRKNITKDVKYISMDLGVGDSSVDYSHLDIKGDLREIPLADNSVDVIICIQVLEHLPQPWNVLKEFYRILKPGGLIYASCPQGEPQHQVPYDFFRYTIFGLESIFTSSGFLITWIKPQKGNFSKMANDLYHSARIFLADRRIVFGYGLKLFARMLLLFYSKFDQDYYTNTTGHFIKARKE